MDKLFKFVNNVIKIIVEETRIKKEAHEKNVADGIIDPEIGLDKNGPCAKGNKIFFSPNHMKYLWCVCYFMAFIYEVYVHKNRRVPKYTVDFANDPAAKRALEVLKWGKFQLKKDLPFPEGLPNPDVSHDNKYLTEIEISYALKTNAIWIKAMAFIFLHEYFHILLGHTKRQNVSNEERIEMEWEAEKEALEHIKLPEDFKSDDSIGLLSLMLSNFFALVDIRSARPDDHLPLNERLDKALQHLEFQCGLDMPRIQYFYHFSSIGLVYGVSPISGNFNDLAIDYPDARNYFNHLYSAIVERINQASYQKE